MPRPQASSRCIAVGVCRPARRIAESARLLLVGVQDFRRIDVLLWIAHQEAVRRNGFDLAHDIQELTLDAVNALKRTRPTGATFPLDALDLLASKIFVRE